MILSDRCYNRVMRMKLGREAVLAAAVSVLAMPVWADANADANRLFVGAMQAWKQVEQIQGDSLEQAETRLELLQEIEANLNRIIDDYASSDLAVQLLMGNSGVLNLELLSYKINDAEIEVYNLRAYEKINLAIKSIAFQKNDQLRENIFRAFLLSLDAVKSPEKISLLLSDFVENELSRGMPKSEMQKLIAYSLYMAKFEMDRRNGGGLGAAKALSRVAEVQANVGDASSAKETLDLALVAAKNEFFYRSRALSQVAKSQAAIGNFSDAFKTVELIEGASSKFNALREISFIQSASEDIMGALETMTAALSRLSPIGHGDEIYSAKLRIAMLQALNGDWEQALKTAAQTVDRFGRPDPWALISLGEKQVDFGNIAEAEETLVQASALAQKFKNEKDRHKALCAIAIVQIRSGDIDGAGETLFLAIKAVDEFAYTDFNARSLALTEVAQIQASADHLNGAHDTLMRAVENIPKIGILDKSFPLLMKVAEVQVVFGDLAEAKETLARAVVAVGQEVHNADKRSHALGRVAQAQISAGDISGAQETLSLAVQNAKGISDAYDRALAFSSIAEIQSNSGDVADYQKTLVHILEAIREIRPADARSESLYAFIEKFL